MQKRVIAIFIICLVITLGLSLKSKNIGSADENTELPESPTIALMKEYSKTDDTLLKKLDNSDDTDYIVAYPEKYGGGYITCPEYHSSMSEVLNETGSSVVYKDDSRVTVGEVKQAIEESQE